MKYQNEGENPVSQKNGTMGAVCVNCLLEINKACRFNRFSSYMAGKCPIGVNNIMKSRKALWP